MTELIEINKYPVKDVLNLLLTDKTTGKNIVFATDTYRSYGFSENSLMTEAAISGFDSCDIQPRIFKAQAEQNERTRKKAEVFTPTWICNQMNNHIDSEWFGRENVFNTADGQSWKVNCEKIIFPKDKNWITYIDSRRLEITCGEAPYIVSRYDATTGEIIPIERRIGLLDRKLRIVNENAATEDEWLEWAARAFQSIYGYEFQGDNLLIARINLLVTFCDYLEAKWNRTATKTELRKIANIIAWNIWQMNGLTDTIPIFDIAEEFVQMSLFDKENEKEPVLAEPCKIYNHRSEISLFFKELKNGRTGNGMKFDYVIGNPPYQEETESDSSRMPPVYNLFMEAAYSVAEKVELITPARFLFNAGYTPKAWNEKMLNDEHFKVIYYETDASTIFANTEIKGGIAITYRDDTQNFGSIGIFTKHNELNSIIKKVATQCDKYLNSIAYPPLSYGLTELFISQNPNSLDRLRTSAFSKLSEIFFEEKPKDNADYIQIVGLHNTKRTRRYVKRDYIKDKSGILSKWTYIIPEANGNGEFGEKLTSGELIEPDVAFLQTFVGMGAFDSKAEAENISLYIKTKFARALLGVFKITQHCSPNAWKKVPLQDFTSASDIDWSKSVAEIDRQLYKKYGLSEDEIDFIETHVKEMT